MVFRVRSRLTGRFRNVLKKSTKTSSLSSSPMSVEAMVAAGGRRESCVGFVLPKDGWEPKDEKREELGQNSSQKNLMLGGICALGSLCIPVPASRAVGKHSVQLHGGAGKLEWPLPTHQGFVVWGGWARMLWHFLQTSRQRWAGGRHQQHPRSPPRPEEFYFLLKDLGVRARLCPGEGPG